MAWINNPGRITSLTIDGTEFINNLLSFQLNDESFNQNGIITTSGQIELANISADYERSNFVRGETVLVDISINGAAAVRHPRGHLFVIGSVYSADNETTIIEVGCQLALKELTRDIQDLVSYIPPKYTSGPDPAIKADDIAELDDTQIIRQALAQDGLAIYADNTNTIQQISVFDNVSTSNFVSIKGVTTESVQPLVNEPLPDSIEISYTYPTQTTEVVDDIITETEITTYPVFVNIPRLERRPPDSLSDTNPRPSLPRAIRPVTGCGGSLGDIDDAPPLYEAGDDGESCSGGFITVEAESSITTTTTNTVTTEYKGYARQQSQETITQEASAYEINSAYYDDYLSFCIDSFASACNPNGNCVLPSTADNNLIRLREITTFTYNTVDGGLVQTVTDQFLNVFSALRPIDWRAGVRPDGSFSEFTVITPTNQLFLARRTVVVINPYGNGTETKETVWESPLVSSNTRGSGSVIGLASTKVSTEYKKISRRVVSISTASRPPNPPILGENESSETSEQTFIQPIFSNKGLSLQPYNIQASLLINANTKADAEEWVQTYGDYLRQLTQGEAQGLTIVEGLRSDIVTNWRPGLGMRYSDNDSATVIAGVMDACVWGANTQSSGVGWRFLVNGISNGTVVAPSNTVGDGAVSVPPSVSGETKINIGTRTDYLTQNTYINVSLTFGGSRLENNAGIVPTLENTIIRNSVSSAVYWTSLIVEPGELLSLPSSGTVPVDYQGIILTDESVIVDQDVFS